MKKKIEIFVCSIEFVAWYFLKDWKINVFENIFFTRVLYRHYFQKLKCTFKKRIWNRVVPKWLLLDLYIYLLHFFSFLAHYCESGQKVAENIRYIAAIL